MNFKKLVHDAGFSQKGLSRKSGVTLSIIQRLCQGRKQTRNLSLWVACKLADALNVDVREFL